LAFEVCFIIVFDLTFKAKMCQTLETTQINAYQTLNKPNKI